VVHSLLTVEREWKGLCVVSSGSPFVETLLGRRIVRGDTENRRSRDSLMREIGEIENLNQYQKEAIEAAVDMDRRDNGIVLLQGPPGTGTTLTLLWFVHLQMQRVMN
jgi:superfamily II DNA or RNA helicase